MERKAVKIFRVGGETRGAEIAETAIIMPLLFMFVLAIFWFGQAFRMYGTITQAARAGARAAVAPTCATCVPLTTDAMAENAVTAINSTLAIASVTPAQVQAPVQTPNLCPCGSLTPSCSAGSSTPPVGCYSSGSFSSNVCVQPNVQLSYSGIPNGGAGSCGTSVSFSYRNSFNFTIPFTDLNLANIPLSAQAQMRLETQ